VSARTRVIESLRTFCGQEGKGSFFGDFVLLLWTAPLGNIVCIK